MPLGHGPRHVKTHPAWALHLHHLRVQHHHLVVVGAMTAVSVEFQLGDSYTDLPVILIGTVSAELVEPQLGGVDRDLSVGPAGGELHFVELRDDLWNLWQLDQKLVAWIT